jgi:hypothetical protein
LIRYVHSTTQGQSLNRLNFSPEELLKDGLPPRREFKTKSSRYIGVSGNVVRSKWRAFISLPKSVSGQEFNRHIGTYNNEDQAACVRDHVILKLAEQVCCAR